MAKCGITNISGGGGIGSDELSVTKKQVLKGKTYVGADTNDEIGAGELDLGVISAGSGDVLASKIIVDKDGNPIIGTLALTGNATDGQVLAGSTYYSTDPKTKRTGTMPSMGAQTINPTASQQVVSSANKYMTGNVTVNGVSNLTASNIKKAQTVGGTAGTCEWVEGNTSSIGKFNIPWTNNINTFLDIVASISTSQMGLIYDSVSAFHSEYRSLILGFGTLSRGNTKLTTTTGVGGDVIMIDGASTGASGSSVTQIILLSVLRYDPTGSTEPGRLKIYGYAYNPSQFGSTPPSLNFVLNGGVSIKIT